MSAEKSKTDHCTYKIVYESTLDQLEKTVNELIAQAWEGDGSGYGKWELQGEVGFDGKNYFQVVIRCPIQNATAAKL